MNTTWIWNSVFNFCTSEHTKVHKVQKLTGAKCDLPSSEPNRLVTVMLLINTEDWTNQNYPTRLHAHFLFLYFYWNQSHFCTRS